MIVWVARLLDDDEEVQVFSTAEKAKAYVESKERSGVVFPLMVDHPGMETLHS